MEILDCDRKGWLNRGKILESLGKYQAALICYERAIKIKPNYYQAWNGTGVMLELFSCLEAAESCFDRALGRLDGKKVKTVDKKKISIPGQDIASCCYNLACFQALQGNRKKAIAFLQQAINLEGDKYRVMSQRDSDFDSIRAKQDLN